jgi:predicted  nucleic acid-binding Zn-ribbon protein
MPVARVCSRERAAKVMSPLPDEEDTELRRLHSEANILERDIRDMGAREHRQETLIAQLRREVDVRDEEVSALRERLDVAEHELEDLRAIRDALAPPELPERPGLELAAAFLPAAEQASAKSAAAGRGRCPTESRWPVRG